MKQTVLHARHVQAGASMTEFQGWSVPAQFSHPSDEYHAVRTAAGLFDVGFLGRIEISGNGAETSLQRLFSRNIAKLAEGAAIYGLFCNDQGGIVDAVLLFRLPSAKTGPRFLVTANAVATDRLLERLSANRGQDVVIADRTGETAHIALQGPHADAVLEAVNGTSFKRMKQKNTRELAIAGIPVVISRTGFTAERGFELVVPADQGQEVWKLLFDAGKDQGLLPCGMTCREMLRLEAGYPLTGNDLDETRNPVDAGLLRLVNLNTDFTAKDAIAEIKTRGPQQLLVAFELFDKGVPLPGGTIFSEVKEIGAVTSGAHSIARRCDIGLGYVLARYSQPGQEIEVEVKDREIAAKIVALPLYRKK